MHKIKDIMSNDHVEPFYDKGDIISRDTVLNENSELFQCTIADEDSAFFTSMANRGGFVVDNKKPAEGFRSVSEEELIALEERLSNNYPHSNAENLEKAGVNMNRDEIVLQLYLAHLNIPSAGDKLDNKIDKRNHSDKAITKTIAAVETLFGYRMPKLIERYGE